MLAIFMIVTLAAIGVYVLTVSTGQIEAATQDEQATRAYQAARSGIDWAAFQLLRNGGDCAAINQTLTLPQGFFATVGCAVPAATEFEGATARNVFQISATGCNNNPCPLIGAGPTYVERQLSLTLAR
jgi:MSHA biogenesis protein MshP